MFRDDQISQHASLTSQTQARVRVMGWEPESPLFDPSHGSQFTLHFDCASAACSQSSAVGKPGSAIIKLPPHGRFMPHQNRSQIVSSRTAYRFPCELNPRHQESSVKTGACWIRKNIRSAMASTSMFRNVVLCGGPRLA